MPQSGIPIDIFGQHPRLHGTYTQLCFLFPLKKSNTSQADIEAFLRAGLRSLARQVSWVAGDVSRSGSGVYEIHLTRTAPNLLVLDLRALLPAYSLMRDAHFPFSVLDEKVIAPCPTLPSAGLDAAPVFILQANFVEGGLLLVFNGLHSCMDLRGLAQLIELFAKACKDEAFAEDELRVANLTSFSLVRPANESISRHSLEQPPTELTRPTSVVEKQDFAKATWVYFIFSALSLRKLKEAALQDKVASFISTDDVLSAFLWQAIMRARKMRFDDVENSSKFERQVNARKHVSIPNTYIGNMVWKSEVVLQIAEVLSKPFGCLASHLRHGLEPTPSIGERMRDAAEELQRNFNTTRITKPTTRQSLPLTDIRLSSWAQEKCCYVDFGGALGIADAVRRPSFEAWEGLAYFMPRACNGDIAVAVSLRDEDVATLRSDDEFCSFAEFIG